MDFATFHRNRHKKNNKRRQTEGPDEAPEYYEHIAKKICLLGEHEIILLHQGKLKQEILTPIQPDKWWVNQIETRLNEPSIDIWTDGSLYANTGDIGASAIFNKRSEDIHVAETIKRLGIKPPRGNASSTKSELWAILRSLSECGNNVRIRIFTDSQASIDAIYTAIKFTETGNYRGILKLANHEIILAILDQWKRMVITPVLCKVPAHSNWKYNEEADVLAKSSATDNQKLNEDLYLNPKLRLLYKEEKIAGKYARDVIKKIHRRNS